MKFEINQSMVNIKVDHGGISCEKPPHLIGIRIKA